MPTHIGIGFSKEPDDASAVKNAAYDAKINLNQERIDCAVIVSTPHYDAAKTAAIAAKTLGITDIIGGSSAGIILSEGIYSYGVAVLAISSDEIKFSTSCVKNIAAMDKAVAGVNLAQKALTQFPQKNHKAFFYIIDGYLPSTDAVLSNICEVLGHSLPILGAGACDNFRLAKSFQIFGAEALSKSAVGLLMGGNCDIAVSGRHGWKPLGKPRVIDKSTGNVIHTINEKKAILLYEEYLRKETNTILSSQLSRPSILYPLGIRIEGSREYLLRNAIDIREDGSIVSQGEIPEGAYVHIMIGNKESARQAAKEAAQDIYHQTKSKKIKFILLVSSFTRLRLLNRSAYDEVQEIKKVLGAHIPIFGMYAHGEAWAMQNLREQRRAFVQNQSVVIMAVC